MNLQTESLIPIYKLKTSDSNSLISLISNFKEIEFKSRSTKIFQYSIKILPEIPPDSHLIKSVIRGIKKELDKSLGKYIHDGMSIFSTTKTNSNDLIYNTILNNINYEVTILSTNQELSSDNAKVFFEKVMNFILSKHPNLARFNKRNVYDITKFSYGNGINVIPGFMTSVTMNNSYPMYKIVLKNKMINTITCFEKIKQLQGGRGGDSSQIREYFVGRSVLSNYGVMRFHLIDEVIFNECPKSIRIKFKLGVNEEKEVNLIEYYKEKYNKKIEYADQPLLIKKRNRNGVEENVYFVPELCLITGIDESDKNDDFKNKMSVTRARPHEKMKQIDSFMEYFNSNIRNKDGLSPNDVKEQWGVSLSNDFCKFKGKKLNPPSLIFKQKTENPNNGKFRGNEAFSSNINNWVILYEDGNKFINQILDNMRNASMKLGLKLNRPTEIRIENRDWRTSIYNNKERLKSFDIAVCCLNKRDERQYKEVKNIFLSKIKIPCQCLDSFKQKGTNLSSITGVLNQMIVKAKGILYNIELGRSMTALNKRSAIIGMEVTKINSTSKKFTFIATTNKYHNQILSESFIKNDEKSCPVINFVEKLFNCFGQAPGILIFYRNGVSQYETNKIIESEIVPLRSFLSDYNQKSNTDVRFIYIISNKIVDVKFFEYGGNSNNINNPCAGLIVDDIVTSNGVFYLQPQFVNQGTATPTKFTIIHDNTNTNIDEIERITNDMCYYYWNWSGAIRVPAVQKFAEVCSKFDNLCLNDTSTSDEIKKTPYFI